MLRENKVHEKRSRGKSWTIKSLLEWTTAYFTKIGLRTPRLDAEVLLANTLGVDRLYLYLNMDRPTEGYERTKYREAVRRRARREPVALITGEKEFWSFTFKVVPGVLIPRPDTEILVECVKRAISALENPRILELGVGSGAVSVSILRENERATLVGTDISELALRLTKENAIKGGVASRISLLASDLFEALRPEPQFHVICSNPPYIPTSDLATLEPEIKYFEPLTALDGGKDGLEVIRRIVKEVASYLKQDGIMVLEVGESQAPAVKEIIQTFTSCKEVLVQKDLTAKDRVVIGRL